MKIFDKIKEESYKYINFFQTLGFQKPIKIFTTKPGDYSYYSTVFYLLKLRDGRLATPSEDRKSLIIFSKDTFEIQLSIICHSNRIIYITQLNNDKILTCSEDNTMSIIKLINDNKYNIEQKLTGHSNYVYRAIEMRNNELISISNDKTMKIWKFNNNKYECINTIIFENSNNNCCNFCNILKVNENEFVTYSQVDKCLKFWNSNNYSNISTINDIESIQYRVISLCKLDDDILCTGGKGFYLIRISTHQLIKNIMDSIKIFSVYKCHDGLLLCKIKNEIDKWSLVKYKYKNQNLIKIIEKVNDFDSDYDSNCIELYDEMIISVNYVLGYFMQLWRN